MRQAALRRRPLERLAVAPQVAVASSIPAPTEGWDASSPLAKMDPKRAIILDNFFPQPEYLEFERGWVNHSTLLIDSASAGPVETLMAYQSVTNLDDKLFAVAGGTIFDATDATDPGVEMVTELANSRLQFVNYATSANQYLVWVNGADPIQAWDGEAWITPSITDGTETAIAGGSGTSIGDMTAAGGLATAFNGDLDQVATLCAGRDAVENAYIGKTLAAPKIFSRAVIYGSADHGFVISDQGTSIGNMTAGGGLAAVFDGVLSQAAAACAGLDATLNAYVGRTFVSPAKFVSATVYGSNNDGFVTGATPSVTLNIRGKNGSAPASGSDGTIIGSITFTDTADESAGRTISSTDPISSWDHLFVQVVTTPAGNVRIAEFVFEVAQVGISINIRGKTGGAPAAADDGTLLGSISFENTRDESAGRVITSTDKSTAWAHIWAELIVDGEANLRVAELELSEANPATTANYINICVHKNRLWFIQKDSLTAAFLPVDAYQGSLTEYPMVGIFSQGGYLMAMGTWTLDAGEGMDDHAVFITSEGQLAVFKGTDPTVAEDWSLVGVYHLGPPIGYRCLTRVGGDIAVVSIDGVLPLSAALIYDRAAIQNISLTRRIARAMNDAARAYKQNFGWQLIGYSRGTRAILNVPIQEGANQQQYQMNTLHGAWCRRLGRPANCWEVFQDRLFFGGNDGNVCEADTGGTDGGRAIIAQAKTAFNYFGSPGVLKKFGMLQTNMTTNGQVTPSMVVNVDYQDKTPDILTNVPTVVGALWDAVTWDLFFWPQEEFLLNEWQEASAVGYCASINLIVSGQAGGGSGGFWDVDVWEEGQWDALAGGSSFFAMKVNAFNITFEMGGLI